MIRALTLLLLCQLAGTVAARGLALPVPGPVLGLVLLLGLLAARPRLADAVRPTIMGLLGVMSLLFVPAGVGIVQHLRLFAAQGLGMVVALVISTVLALVVAALAFTVTARLMGERHDA